MTISIITCTYNASATLARTLESVATQDYPSVEHIIIDGNSTDGTLQMAEDYRQTSRARHTGHTIVIVSEEDNGLYYAMNKGLYRATGDYLLFLNAGDTLGDEHTLTTVAAAAATQGAPAVVYGETDIVDSEGRYLRARRLRPCPHLTWRDFRYGMLVCHQAFYALTALAKTMPYDTRYRFSADYDWCIRLLRAAEEEHRALAAVPQVVAHYLCEGLTTAHHGASLRERFAIMRRHFGLPQTIILHLWFIIRAVIRR